MSNIIADKKVLVVGLAKTGVASARFAAENGAVVTATDMRSEEALSSVTAALKPLGVRFVLGRHDEEDFLNSDIIVVSPGVPMEHPLLQSAKKSGVDILSEIELASRYIKAPIIAITGTNGKTTTTTIIGEIIKNAGQKCYVGGNIGEPLVDICRTKDEQDFVVAEISSFQLEWIKEFKPKVSLLLNLTEDHLDRYKSYQDYIDAKARIFENQTKDDFAILNRDDELVFSFADKIDATIFPFSRKIELSEGIFCIEKSIVYRHNGNEHRFDTADFKLKGVHNLENIMAAVAASLLVGISPESTYLTVKNFTPLHHRMEFVRTFKGVNYYEDSKATNVGSVEKALESFENITLIAGGKDKGGSYLPLVSLVQQRVKHLILIGEAADRMHDELGALTECHRAASLEEAVWIASKVTESGGNVLMSPACSSFDMFKDYEERAKCFINAVNRL